VHVVVRDPRADPTDKRQFVRLEAKIQRAAEYAYAGIRERQREYARRQERDAPQHERL
jgi:hypothetical protein